MSATATPTTQAPAAIPLDLAQRLAAPAQPARANSMVALRDLLVASVGADHPDLSARQLAVLMILVTEPGPHFVRDLAARLNVSKPAITRALDRLAEHDFARRRPNQLDRRSSLLEATLGGRAHAAWLGVRLTLALAEA